MKQIIKNSATSKIDNRLSYTSERYKGYLIVLDRGGDGYNVYDRHRELKDAGYPSKAAAKNFIDELVANDDIYSSSDFGQIDWRKLDWDEQIQLMKKYIKQYKGAKIFEDFAEYIGEPVEDIIDSFVDAESHRELRIPERMQLDSEYRNDDIYSSSDFEVNASQSYLDRIEELMEQGLDEETASREAYAEFYPDEYDADDYDDSIYSSDSSKAFTGYVRTLCDNCGHLNRVKVTFPEFNKPFEDTNYKCESCGAINELTDPHVYDEDGYIISSTISSKLDKIRAKLLKAVHDVMTSSEFGFLDDEVEDYSAVEIVPVNDNMICIEVRAEVDYDGLWMLKEVCDPIIQKYYPDAYFDMETAGVMQAYISKDVPIKSASNDTYYMQLKRAYKNMRKFDDMDSQSADILDLEDELNSHDTPYERYEHTTDNGCTIFYDDYIKGQEFKNSDLTERETLYYKGKKFVVHYTVKDTYDAKEAFDSFKASISMIAPYDDADYYWARIYNGIIKYIYKGKVMRVNYYFNPEDMSDVDDWNLEDWYSGICDEVVQSLYEANKSIESRMVHN